MVKLGFIGAGKMGGALLGAFLKSGKINKRDVIVCESTAERATEIHRKFGVTVTTIPREVAAASETIFLAVKPQDLDPLLIGLSGDLCASHFVVSIAAGKTLSHLRTCAGLEPRIARVMPNLPALVGEGTLVYTFEADGCQADKQLLASLLSECGEAMELEERLFDAVTALSGSGPAFFAYMMNTMASAGVTLGLPPDVARTLANRTMLGTARYLQETSQEAASFIKAVSSPGGTTEAGMAKLAVESVADAISETIFAAARRSAELS